MDITTPSCNRQGSTCLGAQGEGLSLGTRVRGSGKTGGKAEYKYKCLWLGRNDGKHSSLVVNISQYRKQRKRIKTWGLGGVIQKNRG